MTARQPEVLLWDAHRAAERIRSFVAGKTEADYLGDVMLRSAVERQFEIVGEALARLRRLDPTLTARIPTASAAVAMRNRLIHGYEDVNVTTVWTTIVEHIPPLIAALAKLLQEYPPSAPGNETT
jgi:uncharacterized protein with HEPN domain